MKQDESSPDIKEFIDGLKILIRNQWPTQEEFAKTVTTKVNISNILRGKVGTSQSMRQALAARAGKSVEEIIALGRRVSQGANIVLTTEEPPVKDEPYEPKYGGKSTAELLNAANGLTAGLQSEISGYNKEIANMINDVADERDRLVKFLSQESSVTSALPSEIMAVDRNMKITCVNRAMMEKFMIFPGDNLVGNKDCPFGSEIEGMVKKVFNREGVTRKLIKHDHNCYGITACPIVDSTSWVVTQVVVSITPASPWIDLLKEAGWTPPAAQVKKNI